MFERLKAMLIKEFIQVFRDPRMRFLIFVIPVFQTVVFGYAVNTDVRNVRVAVHDLDNTPESREVMALFTRSGYFSLVENVNLETRTRELIDRGKVKGVLHVTKGFGEAIRSGKKAPLQIIIDGTDSNTGGIILGYTGRIVADLNDRLQEKGLKKAGIPAVPGRVELQTRAWFNPNLDSPPFYVPAVIANIVFIITMLLSSMAVVREREIGTMEQIIVTPIGRAEFLLGKTIPFVLIGFIDVAVISLVATFWFHIRIMGSIPLLFGATALFLMSSLGCGLFISTVSRTQQQAMMSAFFFIFPAMLLSGFAFPIENMPPVVQWVTYIDPLRYYLVIIRGIFLKGIGFDILWPQFAYMAILGLVILGFAVSRFRKTL
jgi:ABC-2 type transport system permease protein